MELFNRKNSEAEIVVDRADLTSGGGMDGGHIYITAVREGTTDTIKVSSDVQEFRNMPEHKEDYTAKPELFDDIAKEIEESRFWNAAGRPKSDILVLDAPGVSLSIKLRNGEYITVGDYQDLSAEEWAAWRKIIGLLQDKSYRADN